MASNLGGKLVGLSFVAVFGQIVLAKGCQNEVQTLAYFGMAYDIPGEISARMKTALASASSWWAPTRLEAEPVRHPDDASW